MDIYSFYFIICEYFYQYADIIKKRDQKYFEIEFKFYNIWQCHKNHNLAKISKVTGLIGSVHSKIINFYVK